MPVLDILDRDGGLRWDAPGVLEAALYLPRQPDLRVEYEARWRAEHQSLLPPAKRLSKKTTHSRARAFGGRNLAANRLLRKHRIQIERIGTALLLQADLSMTDPSNATESKVGYTLGKLDKQGGLKTSRSTLKRDWATYRGVAHWCAAVAYQRRVFGAPLVCHPFIGPVDYSIYQALWDFLEIGFQFFSFARDSGCFAATQHFDPERDLWTLPAGLIGPKRNDAWPDCNRIRALVVPKAVLAPLQAYSATEYRA